MGTFGQQPKGDVNRIVRLKGQDTVPGEALHGAIADLRHQHRLAVGHQRRRSLHRFNPPRGTASRFVAPHLQPARQPARDLPDFETGGLPEMLIDVTAVPGGDCDPHDFPVRTSPPGLLHIGFCELCEEAGEEGVVPAGSLDLAFHRSLGAFELGEVERDAAQQGDVLRSMIQAISGLVLIHGDVEDPMQSILDAPMSTHDLAEAVGGERCAE